MKKANQNNSDFALILGEDEVAKDKITLKNMENSEEKRLDFDEIAQILR